MAAKAEIINVTPALAKALLDVKKEQFQNLNKKVVDAFAGAMQTGKWKFGPITSIKVTTEGAVIDGRHRLAAIAQANVTIPMVIIFGAEE